ncbi:MAG: hypothetical protein J6C59_10270 [Muribaculaceae bacterium]|nr:hypothetical protein [Muribaculaceae bacterium]
MRSKILHIVFVAVLILFAASCEKTSFDDYKASLGIDNPDKPNTGNRPTKDGEIVETGLVDLGLSVKWSACNLSTSTTSHFTSMCSDTGTDFNSWTDGSISYPPENISGTEYDHATALLGGYWRTPTKAEVEELYNKCRISESSYRGKSGFTVTGPSGKAIFLPNGTWVYYMTGTYNLSSGKGYVWGIRRNTEYYDNKDASFSNFDGTDNCYVRPVYGPLK